MAEEKKIQRQVVLSHKDAFKISLRNIRIRFGRSVIVTASICLGVAFLASVLASNSISNNLLERGPEEIRVILQPIEEGSRSRQIWLVTLSLIVCVVGIINSMLMSVTERCKEIGTMKCLGALNRFVIELFILESSLQGIIGSLAGAFLGMIGIVILYLLRYGGVIIHFLPFLSLLKYSLFAVLLGITISILGAVYPAYLSSRMEPAEAIRREV
ncbi:MAG: FtsX-like permease family protein [Candidatus Omnitrophica bacterium]|nr:FtsX-like permease family protein [Candidatus Omnitrophota bacterium]